MRGLAPVSLEPFGRVYGIVVVAHAFDGRCEVATVEWRQEAARLQESADRRPAIVEMSSLATVTSAALSGRESRRAGRRSSPSG